MVRKISAAALVLSAIPAALAMVLLGSAEAAAQTAAPAAIVQACGPDTPWLCPKQQLAPGDDTPWKAIPGDDTPWKSIVQACGPDTPWLCPKQQLAPGDDSPWSAAGDTPWK